MAGGVEMTLTLDFLWQRIGPSTEDKSVLLFTLSPSGRARHNAQSSPRSRVAGIDRRFPSPGHLRVQTSRARLGPRRIKLDSLVGARMHASVLAGSEAPRLEFVGPGNYTLQWPEGGRQ